MARMFERRSNQRHAGRVGVAATRKLKMARMFERRSNHFSFERPFPLEMAHLDELRSRELFRVLAEWTVEIKHTPIDLPGEVRR